MEIPGEIVIGKTQDLFGEKIYEDMVQSIAPAIDRIAEEPLDHVQTKRQTQTVVDTVKETIKQKVLAPVLDNYDVKKAPRTGWNVKSPQRSTVHLDGFRAIMSSR